MDLTQKEFSITTTSENAEVVKKLTRKFNAAAENVVARFALAYSLSLMRNLKDAKVGDSQGKLYKDKTLFGDHKPFYIALICQLYGVSKSHPDLRKLVKAHLDDGLAKMGQLMESNNHFSGLDFLVSTVDKGLDHLGSYSALGSSMPNSNLGSKYDKPAFSDPIELNFGKYIDNDENVSIVINDNSNRNNAHMAIAGKSGSGKSYYTRNLLSQISKATSGQLTFTFLDFKGLSPEQKTSQDYRAFFTSTNANLIDIPETPFPINPLSYIDLVNEANRKMGVKQFSELVASIVNLGVRQERRLNEAITIAFEQASKGEHPSLQDVREVLIEPDAPEDSLTAIIHSLTDFSVFSTEVNPSSLFENNNYISLAPNLPDDIRITSVLLIIHYLYSVIARMPETEVVEGYKGLRYMLVIDEAHVIFKSKRALNMLDKMLREVRSRGVSLMLLTQDIGDFYTPDFDLSQNVELPFLLDIRDKGNIKAAQRFLGVGDQDKATLSDMLGSLEKYQCITNIDELTRISTKID